MIRLCHYSIPLSWKVLVHFYILINVCLNSCTFFSFKLSASFWHDDWEMFADFFPAPTGHLFMVFLVCFNFFLWFSIFGVQSSNYAWRVLESHRGNWESREYNHGPDVMAFLTLHSQFLSRYWDDAFKRDSHSLAMSSVPISSIRPYDNIIFLDQSASIFCTKWCTGHGEGVIGCGWTGLTVSKCTGKVRCDVIESLIS